MAISVETSPSSARTYSGVINSVLIQTEDGRQYDSSIQYNRIRDHQKDYHHHLNSERPRFVSAKPLVLLGLAIFVAVWLFSESNRFDVFPLTVSNHKFGKAKVENLDNDDGIDFESESTDDEIDALNGEDDLQLQIHDEQTTIKDDSISEGKSTDDDDILGEDDNFENDEPKMQATETESDYKMLSATNITNTSAVATTIESRANTTKLNV